MRKLAPESLRRAENLLQRLPRFPEQPHGDAAKSLDTASRSPKIAAPEAYLVLIAATDTTLAHIAIATRRLRQHFRELARVEELAEMSALIVSASYGRFKAATALRPLQYQKRIRLLRARSLLMGGQEMQPMPPRTPDKKARTSSAGNMQDYSTSRLPGMS